MTDTFSIASVLQPVSSTPAAQRVKEDYTRQAAQLSALETTPPTTKNESPRATNPAPTVKAYDRHGEIEKDQEPTGQHFTASF